MPDDRGQRPPFRDRYQDRHQRSGGQPSPRPPFNPRPGGPPPRPPFVPRPAPDSVVIRLRDGDREVEVHGSLATCRQFLDELPALWSRLRPQGSSSTPSPSIALPPPPAAPAAAAAEGRDDHRRDRHARERSAQAQRSRENGHARNGGAATLDEQVVAILRAAGRPISIADIRERLADDVSGQAVRRVLERTEGVANVGGRPAAYRLR